MHKKITLKNGLRLVYVPRKEIQSVTVIFGVGAGSRDESPEVAGVSHVIEHMNFKGTKKRPTATDVAEFIENIGGMVNAFTSKELTGYYVKIASEHLEASFDYISDIVLNALNLPEEFDREKNVVIEDLKMHKDRPMEEVIEIFEEKIFTDKNLGRRVGGYPESVEKITLPQMIEFKKKHYFAENSVLCVVGNISAYGESGLIELAEKYFNLPTGKVEARNKSNTINKSDIVTDTRKIEQTSLIVGFAGPGLNDEEKYAARIMARILGGSMSSRMFTEIREKRGLAYAIDTGCQSYTDTGAIYTQAGVAHDKVDDTIKAIINEYKKIKERPVSKEELDRAKEITKGGILIGLEDSEDYAEMLLSSLLEQGKITTLEEMIKKYQAVTIEDVNEIAKKYFDFDKMIVSIVGPEVDNSKLKSQISKLQFKS